MEATFITFITIFPHKKEMSYFQTTAAEHMLAFDPAEEKKKMRPFTQQRGK